MRPFNGKGTLSTSQFLNLLTDCFGSQS